MVYTSTTYKNGDLGMVYGCFTHLHQHQLQFQHFCSSFNLSPDFCLLTLFNPICTPYAPWIQYLPTFTPYKSTSLVGKYAIHGASGYCFTHMMTLLLFNSQWPQWRMSSATLDPRNFAWNFAAVVLGPWK